MKPLFKYSLLLLLVALYFGQRVDVDKYMLLETQQANVTSEKQESSRELALLTALNSNALPVNTVHEVSSSTPTFRYLPRNNFSIVIEEYKSLFPSRFKYVKNHYLDAFALRQDAGYYVYVLREIIV